VSTKLQEGPIVTWLTDGRTSQVGRRSGHGDDQRSRFARPFAASVDLLHRSGHPDLPVHWQEPMKEGSGEWIRPQLPALVAFPVGVEDETSVVDASEQHHSGGRAPIGRGCGNCHRLGHGLASCPLRRPTITAAIFSAVRPKALRLRRAMSTCLGESSANLGGSVHGDLWVPRMPSGPLIWTFVETN
jgi:hypothetical protein